ncbi:hypothetical protein AMS68_005581 [Peltaster fructicola]|uniref:Uncharacterized protein n=1 Tax=Peltaster fructicola TaxID=286661 RepID=A0A6H0XZ81_9PEZI|nr:hypothetical protein AMS68_005581 [Peltaster fructicola]
MSLFSRMRSKSRRSKTVETNDITISQPSTLPSRRNVLSKAQSQPGSRSNSMRGDSRIAMISHPAYANTNIFGPAQSYLPVPQIPAELQKDRASADKAAKVLGVDPRDIQSAPASPKLHPRSYRSGDDPASRHDSVNSNVEVPRVGRSNSKAECSLEDLALEPAVSERSGRSENPFRRSMSSAGNSHERKTSHDSFRPTNVRRHTIHQEARPLPQIMQRRQSIGRPEQPQRGRPNSQVPSYSMPMNTNRASMHAESEHLSRSSEMIPPPLPGAHQPQAHDSEHGTPSSPFVRPQQDIFSEDRHFSPQPALSRHASHRSTIHAMTPPLAILDGLKVNKRGRILDEEGDPIGELVEGDIIDCVRQKVNGFGEVLDEYGRVVGRVRTLLGSMGVSTPAFNHSSPALVGTRNADYFNLQSQSPKLTPTLDATQRMHDDRQKYRILTDAPPVPSMPSAYQGVQQSPAPTGPGRYSTVPFDSFDGTHCAELSAENDHATLNDVPVFDLSEPFMPVSSGVSEASPPEDKALVSSIMQEPLESPVVPVEPRQEGFSRPKHETTQPSAEVFTEETTAQSATSEDQFEEAETYLDAVQPADVVSEPAESSPVLQTPESETDLPKMQASTPTDSVPPPVEKSFHSKAGHTLAAAPESVRPSLKQEPSKRATKVAASSHSYPRPILATRARSAPSTSKSPAMAPPPLPRAETMPETQPLSATTSGYNSAEESVSEAESVEIQTVQRKEVRISNLPPTTIPARTLNRPLSDSIGLGRFSAMPSVPESEPLPDSPGKNFQSTGRSFGARNSAPLPAFPRQNFANSLPSSPFAAANAANNSGAGLQKRMSLPGKPGIPPVAVRSAMARNNRYTMNAPLVPSPLNERRQTMSHIKTASISSQSSECTPSGSDNGKSDAISIASTIGKSRTYFTHAGRVTVEAGDLPPSLQKKDLIEVTETPIDDAQEQKKKRRFSMKFGKKNNTHAVAAH